MAKFLVTGAFGQIGTELTQALRARHGTAAVVASGRRLSGHESNPACTDPVAVLDVTDPAAVRNVLATHDVDVVYHLAARLSAVGEQDPALTWRVNMEGLRNVLEAARARPGTRVFWPSSIAAFGPETPRDAVPQDTVMRPTTMYGVTKVAGELLADYYQRRYGVDVRGVRFPGVISSQSLPGGGTTDYAVEIFYAALTSGRYTAFVRADTVLPMIYMPDCIRAARMLMDAEPARLRHRNGFNIAAMSFSAGELADAIRERLPGFRCEFVPDERQAIADSWPRSIDDRAAREEWDWAPEYDLTRMTDDMLTQLGPRLQQGSRP
ncbi:MAG: NAD-dependent epimerase/dehydratase family protein [Pseudomonadales bacterium]